MRAIKKAVAAMQALVSLAVAAYQTMPISAFAAEESIRTVTASLFTDETYTVPLLSDTEITLTGDIPADAAVKGYPVSWDIDGMKTLAAYDITIFEADGETVFQPADRTVNVTFTMPELVDTDAESISVFHIDGDGNQTEISGISADSREHCS